MYETPQRIQNNQRNKVSTMSEKPFAKIGFKRDNSREQINYFIAAAPAQIWLGIKNDINETHTNFTAPIDARHDWYLVDELIFMLSTLVGSYCRSIKGYIFPLLLCFT